MASQEVPKPHFPSFRRKPESRKNKQFWTPAFAGVTVLMTSYEAINFVQESPHPSLESASASDLY